MKSLSLDILLKLAKMNDLEILKQEIISCNACSLYEESGNRPTPFSGDGSSGVFIIMRNPGEQERDRGVPAIGLVKGYVDSAILAIG